MFEHWVIAMRRISCLLVLLIALAPFVAPVGAATARLWKSCPKTYESFHADLQARQKKLTEKLAGLSEEQAFRFAKSNVLDAKLLRLLWPDLVENSIAGALWSYCLENWREVEDALKEQDRARLMSAIELWEDCEISSSRERLTPPATELVACAQSIAKSWPEN